MATSASQEQQSVANPSSETERSGNEAAERPTVLVVDDEEAMRDSLRQVLEREDYGVLTASRGGEALNMVSSHQPDALLVDLKMPGMSGRECLMKARELDPDLVAVAITGYPSLDSVVDVMKAGAYDYLSKPFEAEQLRMTVERALQKRRLAERVAAGEREKAHMRDNFMAVVSHQLKAPAAVVKECLDVALASFADEVPEGCRDLMERSTAKAGLLLDLMEDWLTLARVESAGITTEETPVDLWRVVETAAQGGLECPEHNDVELRLKQPDRSVAVDADREALRELFFNLIDNAMRYTPDGGTVTVALHRTGGHGVVEVSDSGPGIPEDELALVFEPFFRGKKAKQRHGTGLGLAIAKQIAEAHGGRIDVESEPGRGATFKVYLRCEGEGE
ncbi:MAG: ATP-binding protein [Planctomycetota bacterium]